MLTNCENLSTEHEIKQKGLTKISFRQETVCCSLCGSDNYKQLFAHDGFLVVQCLKCNFCYTLNPVLPDDIANLYDKAYFSMSSENSIECVRGSNPRSERRNKVVTRQLWNICNKRRSSIGADRRLLEVGCGTGYFLREARNIGFDVEGVEISNQACEYVNRNFGIKVHQGELVDSKIIFNGNFQVVVMWHVLEHIPRLDVFMKQVKDILARNGLIAIEVPNLHSLKWRLSQHKFDGGLHPKFHRYIFSHSTLKQLLAKHGFRVIYDGGQSMKEFVPFFKEWNGLRSIIYDICRFISAPLLSTMQAEMPIRVIAVKER